MTTPVMSTIQDWQEELFELIDRVEEPVVRFVGDIAESLVDYTPERPSWPFLAQLPTLTELIDNQASFYEKLIEQQAAFAHHLVKAAHPVLGKLEAKPAPARKSTRKAPAAAKAA